MTVKETILDETLHLFKREGIEALSEADIWSRLDISQATYNELFRNKEDLVRQTIEFDIEKQKKEQEAMQKAAAGPIDEILQMLQKGIRDMKTHNPTYVLDLVQHYPRVWEYCLEYLSAHSYHQLYDILNRGVQAGEFRKDINMQLVTKIMLEQLTMMFNPQIFPPDRYDLSEVYRSIYLYYIRGICTESGSKKAEEYFAKYSL
jgi:AcrR family transcriptional regulator